MNTNKDALDAFEWLYRSYIQANNCSVANNAADAIRQALQTQAELVEALRWIFEKCDEEMNLEYKSDEMRKVFQRNVKNVAYMALEQLARAEGVQNDHE